MEDQLLEKQLHGAIIRIKNVRKERMTADRLLSHLNKIGASSWCQESINDMGTLQRKGVEDLISLKDIDMRISPVISDTENSYSI